MLILAPALCRATIFPCRYRACRRGKQKEPLLHMMKNTTPRRFATVAMTLLLAVSGAIVVSAPVQAADSGNKIGKFADFDYSDVPFLGSLKMPTASGSLSDANWLNAGPITSEASCPATTQASVTRIVLSEGDIHEYPVADTRIALSQISGMGLDGNPIRLSNDMPSEYEEQYALFSGGMAWNEEIPAGSFWFVITCDPNRDGASASKLDAPYFAVKLESDGTNWTAPDSGPVVTEKATTTTLGVVSSRVDGRVDFTASVTADGAGVSNGSVDFVDSDTGSVLASAPVAAGKATAVSNSPISAVKPVPVKAVYKPGEGFLASESAVTQVTGVRGPGSGSGSGDVTVEVPEGVALEGAVKFTAVAAATLGEATVTKSGLEASGRIDGAVVTDTRQDKSAAWTVNGKTSAFTTSAAPSGAQKNEIPASALSWTPAVKTGTTLPTGAAVGAKDATLNESRVLVGWTGSGTGGSPLVSEVGAALKLAASGEFVGGKYTATLTLTLV